MLSVLYDSSILEGCLLQPRCLVEKIEDNFQKTRQLLRLTIPPFFHWIGPQLKTAGEGHVQSDTRFQNSKRLCCKGVKEANEGRRHRSCLETLLVAQWLRLCLPLQGTQVPSLVGVLDSTCCTVQTINKQIKHFFLKESIRVVSLVWWWWFNPVKTLATPWTVAHQATPSMGFPRQGYWSGWPFPFPGDLTHPGIKPRSPALQADSLPTEPPGRPH